MADYDIFISCKSEDYEIAGKVYSFLKDNGFSVFLSSKELRRMAQADYMDAISVALDTAYSMIVISTKKEYLTSKWVKFEWSTFLNEILSGRKTGQIMTLADNIKVHEFPIQLRKYESFTLENYEDILPYLENPKKQVEPQKEVTQDVNNDRTNSAEVHVETDIPCRIMRFKEELITAVPDDDNQIKLKKGTHKLKFVSIENEQDNYSQVFTVKDDCEFLQVNLTKIRDTRLAKEEAERRAKEEAERRAKEEAERRAKEEAERRAKEEAERRAKEVAERRAKEEAERRAKEEAERKRLAEDDAKYQTFIENGKYGFKKDGVVVIPAKYDDAQYFSEGLAAVKLGGIWGFSKWGYIDKDGKEVIPIKYDNAWYFSDGLVVVKLNGKYGYIDKAGKEVIPIKYDNAWPFVEGLARVNLNGKYGFIDKTGKEVIPIKYNDAAGFSEGLTMVELNGKYGYIDKTGKEVIPIKYDEVWPFYDGKAMVRLNGKRGTIDKQGNFTPDE